MSATRIAGRTIREVALEEGLLTPEEADALLDPRRLAHPHDRS